MEGCTEGIIEDSTKLFNPYLCNNCQNYNKNYPYFKDSTSKCKRHTTLIANCLIYDPLTDAKC